jgi:hypothetical protein
MKEIPKNALINSLLTAVYIVVISLLIHFLGNNLPEPENSIVPLIAMLLLFVFSAALTGFLVLGRPIIWYIDGKRKQAVSLLLYTLALLFIIIVIAFIILFILAI